MYETWWKIENSIRRFDRIFNKVEKFSARKFADPVNHDRREARMLERRRTRWTENYTYYFGGLTEEEQQYRDYFETDIEEDPEDGYVERDMDEQSIASTGEFQFKKFDFVETSLDQEPHEHLEDLVD